MTAEKGPLAVLLNRDRKTDRRRQGCPPTPADVPRQANRRPALQQRRSCHCAEKTDGGRSRANMRTSTKAQMGSCIPLEIRKVSGIVVRSVDPQHDMGALR